MATTTNYAWETPDDTDLVKDGAAAIRTLGSSIDTTTKALNPSTTLGDIEYRSSTANTNARLGVGTSGQVLTVAGGVPTWASPAGGGKPSFYPIKKTGFFLSTPASSVGSVGANEDRTYFVPIYLPTCTLDRINCGTDASFSGTSSVRLGIYNADATTNLPSTVLLDAGTVSCTAANTQYLITISQAVTEGFYWLAFNSQTNATTNNYQGMTAALAQINVLNMRFSDTQTQSCVGVIQNGVTGAFGTFSFSDVTGNSPFVWVRQA